MSTSDLSPSLAGTAEGSGARLAAIDRLRGLVMVLMATDHASALLNSGKVMPDGVFTAGQGAELLVDGAPWQFLTRWASHLCAPTFVFLAGVALALSAAKRALRGANEREFDWHMLQRGALLILLELWIMLPFGMLVFQVMYAIGAAMIAMVVLRRLPPPLLLVLALVLLGGTEALVTELGLIQGPWRGAAGVQAFLLYPGFLAAIDTPFGWQFYICVFYPLFSWLPLMMLGWCLGQWIAKQAGSDASATIATRCFQLGAAALAVFVVQRVVDGYGDFGLIRGDDTSWLRWLQVSKYPVSIAFAALEIGLALVLLGVFFKVPGGGSPKGLLPLLGRSALFYYVLHMHLLALVPLIGWGGYGGNNSAPFGVESAWLGGLAVTLLLWPACTWFVRYKAAHPSGWARFF